MYGRQPAAKQNLPTSSVGMIRDFTENLDNNIQAKLIVVNFHYQDNILTKDMTMCKVKWSQHVLVSWKSVLNLNYFGQKYILYLP